MEKKDFDALTPAQKEEIWKTFGRQEKEEVEKKQKPIRSVFIPLGSDYNAKFTLWDNNLQVVKSRKKDNEWEDYQKINLSKRLLIELHARIPSFIAELESREETR